MTESVSTPPLLAELRQLDRQLDELKTDVDSESLPDALRSLRDVDRRLRCLADVNRDAATPLHNRTSEVIADLDNWKQLASRLELDESVAEADRLWESHLQHVADNWLDTTTQLLTEPDADNCFRHVIRTTALQLETQRQGHGKLIGVARFDKCRGLLREALLQSIERTPPSQDLRQRWVTQLLDLGDMVMTSVDDLPPATAAAQIAVVVHDCGWHLRQVELASGKLRRQLKRRLARIRAEEQERLLQHRLDQRFGRRFVAGSEQLVLCLIFVVIGLMIAEFVLAPSTELKFWFGVIDAGACFVFLVEFFTKLWHAPGRWLWFRRHFAIDLVPSIPFALLTSSLVSGSSADSVRLGRLARLLRLPRLVRYIRILRPFIRLLRAFGLLAHGLDRVARRYGHILNQNVILYPTREELERARRDQPVRRAGLWKLQAKLTGRWNELLLAAPSECRPAIAANRLTELESTLEKIDAQAPAEKAVPATNTREIPIGTLIEELQLVTPRDLEANFSEPLVAQFARVVRTFALPPLRWFPIIRSCVPHLSDDMTDSEVAAASSRRMARLLKWNHDTWFWVADLYGTVTPSQFIDRLGTTLVNSSFRPAYKLALFGGVLLLTQLLLYVTAFSALESLVEFLGRYVGTPVLVLGGVCIFVLAWGWWLKRLAREATEFYERSAQAQHLSLMETVRSRQLNRDTAILYDRILGPESSREDQSTAENRKELLQLVRDRARHSLLDEWDSENTRPTSEVVETTVLLYRDWLDGGLLTESDTRATSQLLGNPAVRQFLSLSDRYTGKEIKALQKLDLVRQKSLLGGPYLWFNFISRSIAHSVACLLVDYNQNAIPLNELSRLSSDQQQRFQAWLQAGDSTDQQNSSEIEEKAERSYMTTAFTAMHFLDFHPRRDRDIETRFGEAVLQRLRTDRSLLIRRIFGTYPMHNRPKEQRVVNLYALYSEWLAGGRALLLPLLLAIQLTRYVGDLFKWIQRAIREIRDPRLRMANRDAAQAHYTSAVRKIRRIRGPVVDASLRLRSRMDPEFLGIALPGETRSGLAGADLDVDLAFIRPDLDLADELEEERLRARADMHRLDRLIQQGLLCRAARSVQLDVQALSSRQHVRAAAVVYLADLDQVRSSISPVEILKDAFGRVVTLPLLPRARKPRPLLKRMFANFWAEYGSGDDRARLACWRATQQNYWGAADALRMWYRHKEQATAAGERKLAELLMVPGRIDRQLLAVRTIQTLSVLDVLHYREHVYHLGQYADMGDQADDLLCWNTVRPN